MNVWVKTGERQVKQIRKSTAVYNVRVLHKRSSIKGSDYNARSAFPLSTIKTTVLMQELCRIILNCNQVLSWKVIKFEEFVFSMIRVVN